MSDFFTFHVECAESLDAGGVDDVASFVVHFKHLGEGGGVLACLVGIADFVGAEVEVGE